MNLQQKNCSKDSRRHGLLDKVSEKNHILFAHFSSFRLTDFAEGGMNSNFSQRLRFL